VIDSPELNQVASSFLTLRVPKSGAIYLSVEVEIRPILNSVTSHIRQVLTLTTSLVLLGLLSGCFAAQLGILAANVAQTISTTGGDQPPQVLCTAEDSIGVRYKSVNNNQRDEAMQLISEHCVDGYIETFRNDSNFVSYIFASCLQADGSPPVLQSCTYVESDISPTGFAESY